jgi:hypothetical protein
MWCVAAALLPLATAASSRPYDFNCSYNGHISAGGSSCTCAPSWRGRYCQSLNLGPARNGSGLDQLHAPPYTSTWGGSVVYDHETKLYHMYASEITGHCGIHRWVTNSIVVHATSRGGPDWRFTRRGEVKSLFTHEPIVARAPSGEFVVYVTHYPGNPSDCPTCNCTDGNSASGGCMNECGPGKNRTMFSYFTYSRHPDGPWSALQSLCAAQQHGDDSCLRWSDPAPQTVGTDMNLAPVIRHDGSALMWTRWDVWLADDWRNASSYHDTGQGPDFNSNPPTPWEGEDPSLFQDKDGHYHMVSHNGARGKDFLPTNASGDCGRHYFSTTGAAGTWRVAPLPPADLGGCAFPRAQVPFMGKNGSITNRCVRHPCCCCERMPPRSAHQLTAGSRGGVGGTRQDLLSPRAPARGTGAGRSDAGGSHHRRHRLPNVPVRTRWP